MFSCWGNSPTRIHFFHKHIYIGVPYPQLLNYLLDASETDTSGWIGPWVVNMCTSFFNLGILKFGGISQ